MTFRYRPQTLGTVITVACGIAPNAFLAKTRTGVEFAPENGERNAWHDALHAAAHREARIVQYLTPETTGEEAAAAQALADEYRRCECASIANFEGTGLWMFHTIMAWEGERERPRQAMLWLESARERSERETSAEFHDTRCLRRNEGMLEEFAESVERAAKRPTRDGIQTIG